MSDGKEWFLLPVVVGLVVASKCAVDVANNKYVMLNIVLLSFNLIGVIFGLYKILNSND